MITQIEGISYRVEPATNLCMGCSFHTGYGPTGRECTAPSGVNCRGVIYKKTSSTAIPHPQPLSRRRGEKEEREERGEGASEDYCDVYNYDPTDEYKDIRLFPALLVIVPLYLIVGMIALINYPIYKLKKRINNGKRKKSSTHGCNK